MEVVWEDTPEPADRLAAPEIPESAEVSGAPDVLDTLAAALADERQALLTSDIQRLLQASQAKLEALTALESGSPAAGDARLADLREANAVNGALLARCRRLSERAVRALARTAGAPGYDAHGRGQSWHNRRSLAVA